MIPVWNLCLRSEKFLSSCLKHGCAIFADRWLLYYEFKYQCVTLRLLCDADSRASVCDNRGHEHVTTSVLVGNTQLSM